MPRSSADMRIALFYHSLISDWNHGNAHFLRGVATELISRGHDVRIYEPLDSWSAANLAAEYGESAIQDFYAAFPRLRSCRYTLDSLDLERELDRCDLVIVHEWNDPALVSAVGNWRRWNRDARLLFHDTHHRSVTDPAGMSAYDLREYDGVLAFGGLIRDLYLRNGWAERGWVWHEAADTNVFCPRKREGRTGDVVWVGNWGDDERSAEIREFLIDPVRALHLSARVHGVRYPADALRELGDAGIEYGGWIPNYRVPDVFASFRATVHIPRRPYVEALPGIPTIRPFEALACGIPLISAPWNDWEGLFRTGVDYLVAADGIEMSRQLSAVLNDASLRAELTMNGLETILSRHTCAHRVDELMSIYEGIAPGAGAPVRMEATR